MQDRELERLIDVITDAVRVRLGQGGRPGSGGGYRAHPPHEPLRYCNGDEPCSTGSCLTGDGSCGYRVQGLIDAGAQRIGAKPGMGQVPSDVARTIDHTLLKPEATADDVRKICDEARQYSFASVCVNAAFVPLARSLLAGTTVKTVAVVGFPLGATLPAAKAYEACEAVRSGADEIDMVINIGALKGGDYQLVVDDIRAVVEASRPAPVKVIIETSKLEDEEKVAACTLSKVAGAAFVKTSTGFGGGGATAADVALMRRVVGAALGVKASGGVRTREDADAMIAAGATRIGASASVAIVTGKKDTGKGY